MNSLNFFLANMYIVVLMRLIMGDEKLRKV